MSHIARCAKVGLLVLVVSHSGTAQPSDTTIVRAGPPLNSGVGALVEELTLGNGSTADEYQFTMPFIFSGPDGGVYAVDVTNPAAGGSYVTTVRQYDRTGTFVRSFGRVGRGPGEYTDIPRGVWNLPDGRVLLLVRSAVLVYSATGQPLAQWGTSDGARRLLIDPAGFVLVSGATPVRGGTPIPFLERYGFDGSFVDARVSPEATLPSPPRLAGGLLPFGSRHLVSWSPLGYFVTINTASYAIDMRLPQSRPGVPRSGPDWADGDPVLSIRRSIPPIPLSAAERADWRQSFTFFWRRQNPQWQWDGPDIPLLKPPISGFQIATDGRIWVRVSQPSSLNRAVTIRTAPPRPQEIIDVDAERRWVEPWVYDVFEPSGRYVGQVMFPDNMAPPGLIRPEFVIQGETAWGVVWDRDDVPTIKRYRIRWETRSK